MTEEKEPFFTLADKVWNRAKAAYKREVDHRRVADFWGPDIIWSKLGKAEKGGWEVATLLEHGTMGRMWAIAYKKEDGKWVIPANFTVVPQPKLLRRPRMEATFSANKK